MPTSSPSPDGSGRSRRRALARIGVVVAAGVASFALVRAISRPTAPSLIAVQDVPADVRAELDATWAAFTERFDGRRSCVGDVRVRLVGDVDGGDARYLADTAMIEIRIPTTPARFRESLAHELAHHVERSCRSFESLREQLQPMLGGVGAAWDSGPIWYEVPSERFAEHVVQLVNGRRVRHTEEIAIDDDVLALIAAWAGS